jgi:carbamoyl-phosphate synthase large subunit
MTHAVSASPEHPVLIDKFLDDAIELDVDALGDGEEVVIGGIMEHIERAGVHSGDSACSLPPKSISQEVQDEIRRHTMSLAKALNVCGLRIFSLPCREPTSSFLKSTREHRERFLLLAKRLAYR